MSPTIKIWEFTGEDSAEECFPPGCWLNLIEFYSPIEGNIVRWNKRLNLKVWLLQSLIQTNLIFNCLEYNSLNSPCFSVLICWKFEFKQSLMLNYLTRNGYSCITAILMRVLLVCRTLPKDKHSCRIVQMWLYGICTDPNTFWFFI